MSGRVVASIQARMGSSRLPGKVLKDICGKPMLLWQVERLRESRLVDEIVIATTDSIADDKIYKFCLDHQIKCFRGDEGNVLGRICKLLKEYQVDIHAEFCGDSPLVDPQIVDEFIGIFLKGINEYDFVSSAMETTYPPGLEVSIYRSSALIEVNKLISEDDSSREHCGFNITRFPAKFRTLSVKAPPHLNEPEMYIEVDYAEDLDLIRKIVGHFTSKGNAIFSAKEIIAFLKDHPQLAASNQNCARRWKELRGR